MDFSLNCPHTERFSPLHNYVIYFNCVTLAVVCVTHQTTVVLVCLTRCHFIDETHISTYFKSSIQLRSYIYEDNVLCEGEKVNSSSSLE